MERDVGEGLGFGRRQGSGVVMTLPGFFLIELTIARRRRGWWGAHAAFPSLPVRNYTEEGIANLVNEGTGRTS